MSGLELNISTFSIDSDASTFTSGRGTSSSICSETPEDEVFEQLQDFLLKMQQADKKLRMSMDELHKMTEKIDRQASQCANKVKSATRRLISLVEAQEQQHLMKIDQARRQKKNLINCQKERVCQHISRLAVATTTVQDFFKRNDFLGMVNANYKGLVAMQEAESFAMIKPCEDDKFTFIPQPMEATPNHNETSSLIGNLYISCSSLTQPRMLAHYLFEQLTVLHEHLPFQGAKARSIYGLPSITLLKPQAIPCKVWGKSGSGAGEVSRPWGVTMNRFDQILIADRSNHRIQVLDSEYNYQFHFGSHGSDPGQFDKPSAVLVNPTDNIVVVDKDNHRIQVFDSSGKYMFHFGEMGSNLGQFQYPWDAAIDTMGNIYVSDTLNHRIQMFTWNGIFIRQWGGRDAFGKPRMFDSPRGVALDPFGNLFVTDFNLHRVFVIKLQTNEILFFGKKGTEKGSFKRPQGICCDERGWITVSDSKNNRIQFFDGNFMCRFMLGRKGKNPGEFERTGGLCIDRRGRVHVIDLDNERIQVF